MSSGEGCKSLHSYLSGLIISQGRLAGQKLTPLPWQRRFLRGAMRTDTAAPSIARGNGNSTLVAGVGAAAVGGPLAQQRAETVFCASSFEQGRIVFEHIQPFLADKLSDPKRWRVYDTHQRALIQDKFTGAFVRCIGSDPCRARGLAPSLVICDEPAQ